MSEVKAAVPVSNGKGEQATLALMIELDNVAIQGRRIMFDVLKKLMAERDAELTPVQYMRYCLGCCPRVFLPKLLQAMDKKRLSPEKVAVDLIKGFSDAVANKKLEIPKPLMKLITKLHDKGLAVGALSALPEEIAAPLLVKLGLDELSAQLVCVQAVTEFPSADSWLRLAKKLGVPRARCTALVSSGHAAMSALSGGMRCVALPDEFTSFQDFGGADLVIGEISDHDINAVMSLAGLAYKK